jgi:hypothetical protein
LTNEPSFQRLCTLAFTGSTGEAQPSSRPLFDRPRLGSSAKDGRWNAERPSGGLSSASPCADRPRRNQSRRTMQPPLNTQAMPRGHGGIVGAPRRCLPLPYPGHLSSYLITTHAFFHASHETTPSHDHIYLLIYPSALAVIWHLCIHRYFLILCASCFHYHLSLLIFTFSHTPTYLLSCFSFFLA